MEFTKENYEIEYYMEYRTKQVAEKLLNVLIEEAENNNTYVNPNFLSDINKLIYDYSELEDDKVDEWISDMWGA